MSQCKHVFAPPSLVCNNSAEGRVGWWVRLHETKLGRKMGVGVIDMSLIWKVIECECSHFLSLAKLSMLNK